MGGVAFDRPQLVLDQIFSVLGGGIQPVAIEAGQMRIGRFLCRTHGCWGHANRRAARDRLTLSVEL